MKDVPSKTGLQFSLWELMVIITIACLVLALPAGYVLLAVGLAWLLLAAAITGLLWLLRAPINRFLAGAGESRADEPGDVQP
jgi:hypothetical protein